MVAGDGLRRPLNAPTPGTLGYGVQPGTSNGVIQARLVIVSGANGGLFVYSGTPALGNPPIGWVTGTSFIDPYGNVLPEAAGGGGTGTQNAGGFVQMFGNILCIGDADGTFGSLSADPGGALELNSGTAPGALNVAGITVAPGAAVGAVSITGAINATSGTAAHPTLITTDTWHLMGFLNGWAQQAGNVACQYRLTPTNEVRVVGIMSGNAATARTFAQLPAGYRPVSQQPFFLQVNAAAGGDVWGQCDTSGNLTVQGAAVAAGTYVFSGMISLDA
jgi:hypothetical protein